jgi:hypothetical protein
VNTHLAPTSRSGARVVLAFLLPLAALTTTAQASMRWATLEAIHHLENPRNLSRPGPRGELGAYQFRSSTWRMHTQIPFRQAIERTASDIVAVKHYDWIQRGLERAGVPATPYNIALAWNGGLSAVIAGRAPAVAHDYASRAANLAVIFDQQTRQVASAN